MKLEVGMYVRTKHFDDEGHLLEPVITKIRDMTDYGIYLDDFGNCNEEHIIKASHSLLGNDKEPCLIEVGDYVNGYKIERVDKPCELNPYGSLKYRQNEKCDYEDILGNEIKTIVTKEQFSQMEYRIGE